MKPNNPINRTDCIKLVIRMHHDKISSEYRKAIWAYLRKHGFRCYYTGMILELDDAASPWYLVFGRRVPGDDSTIVLTSALLNEMKSQLTEKEFWYYVLAIDNYRRKHIEVKKIPLVNWRRLYPSVGDKVCAGCTHAIALKRRKYCAKCNRIAYRMKHARLPREAMLGVWNYLRKHGFVCYYTGMPLDLDDPKDPLYLAFDHWMPRDPRKMVITSVMLNDMKTDLTEKEFWYMIRQLADFRRHGSPVRKRKLAYWYRY